jgi:hypothetical protein
MSNTNDSLGFQLSGWKSLMLQGAARQGRRVTGRSIVSPAGRQLTSRPAGTQAASQSHTRHEQCPLPSALPLPSPRPTHAPEAELGVCCKAAAGGEHDDGRRLEGVLRRKGHLACGQTMGQAGRHWGAFREWWQGGVMVQASHARAALCRASG